LRRGQGRQAAGTANGIGAITRRIATAIAGPRLVGREVRPAESGRARLQTLSMFPPRMRARESRTLVQESDQVPPARRAQRIQEKP
jgi:hypothetical protein